MWRKFWNTLQIRPKTWTKNGESALIGLFLLFSYVSSILALSLMAPEAGAALAVVSITALVVGLMSALPFLGGWIVAYIFEQPRGFYNPRDPVANLIGVLLFSVVVVASIVLWVQMGMTITLGPVGEFTATLLTAFAIKNEWLYFYDAFVIIAVAAYNLREEL